VINFNGTGTRSVEVPNFEIFAVPVNYDDDRQALESKSLAGIQSYLDQSQRKSVTLTPGRAKTWVTRKPKVVKYAGPVDKGHGLGASTMGSPYWLSTDNDTSGGTRADETAVRHYGLQLIIRRVDGASFGDPTTNVSPMGGRMTTTVHFQTRKVQ
jgi:hypothetical protein